MNHSDACPHFQTRVERLPLELTTALLPIRCCLLAERMVEAAREIEQADALLDALIRRSDSGAAHCVCGPDLDAIEPAKCKKERCETSCTPAYKSILSSLGIYQEEPACQEPAS